MTKYDPVDVVFDFYLPKAVTRSKEDFGISMNVKVVPHFTHFCRWVIIKISALLNRLCCFHFGGSGHLVNRHFQLITCTFLA